MGKSRDAVLNGETVRLGRMADSLGFLLRLSQLRSFSDFYKSLSDTSVRPGEFSVLMILSENPGVRQGVLGSALMIKRAHMAKMARAMEDAGLITRTVPKDDRRAMQLFLTDRGQQHLQTLLAPFNAHETGNLGALDPSEADALKTLLRKYLGMPNAPTE